MRSIVILCGLGGSGKTRTLKALFGIDQDQVIRRDKLLEKKVDGKIVYAVGLNSPQELNAFCDYVAVIRRIKQSIDLCDLASSNKDYVLIMPFTLKRNNKQGTYNENCITKPIEWLKENGNKVYPLYLRKLSQADLLMEKVTSNEIKSKEDYKGQSDQLIDLIKKHC